jgi:hypothetical protein
LLQVTNGHIEEHGSQVISEEYVRGLRKLKKEYLKHVHDISGWIDNCKTRSQSHQKAQRQQTYEEAENVGQGGMHFIDQNKWHQLASENRIERK